MVPAKCITSVNVIDIVQSEYPFMVVITCKECKESIYLTPHAFWNITDFGAKCPKCDVTNTITLENGELKK
jgi:predicted nucleic-acid-binding Zn-ribbon protein